MTSAQTLAARRVINSAKALERASTYGLNAGPAAHEYDDARAELARLSRVPRQRRAAA